MLLARACADRDEAQAVRTGGRGARHRGGDAEVVALGDRYVGAGHGERSGALENHVDLLVTGRCLVVLLAASPGSEADLVDPKAGGAKRPTHPEEAPLEALDLGIVRAYERVRLCLRAHLVPSYAHGATQQARSDRYAGARAPIGAGAPAGRRSRPIGPPVSEEEPEPLGGWFGAGPDALEPRPSPPTAAMWVAACDLAIGVVVVVPHLLDLAGVAAIYSPGAHGAAMWSPVARHGPGLVRFWDVIYVLIGFAIVLRSRFARIAYWLLSIVGLALLVNGLPAGELDFPGTAVSLVLLLVSLALLLVSPATRRYGWERRPSAAPPDEPDPPDSSA